MLVGKPTIAVGHSGIGRMFVGILVNATGSLAGMLGAKGRVLVVIGRSWVGGTSTR